MASHRKRRRSSAAACAAGLGDASITSFFKRANRRSSNSPAPLLPLCPKNNCLPGHEGRGSSGGASESQRLRALWKIKRLYQAKDAWHSARSIPGVDLQSRDVPHSGCCKAYALALVLEGVGLWDPEQAHGGIPRSQLEKRAAQIRKPLPAALDAVTLELLRRPTNTNHADWQRATSLEDARVRVGLSFAASRKVGFSMSPVWLEEWETSTILAAGQAESGAVATASSRPSSPGSAPKPVLLIELHDRCASNGERSHFQIFHSGLSEDDGKEDGGKEDEVSCPHKSQLAAVQPDIVMLRRIGCHYQPAFVNQRSRTSWKDYPHAMKQHFGLI